MNMEVQVALNFIISYLFNKLPRRRVLMFGEELERAIRNKFVGHWYPECPAKGSAYRCLRVAGPPDPVLFEACLQSGLELSDVLELLPPELNIWIDPGEVSYRISEKTLVKILYSVRENNSDREVARTFNPEAQAFKPVMEQINNSLHNLNLDASNSPIPPSSPVQFKSPSPTPFIHKSSNPVTFTAASFAQTKFGSTKLKSSGRRPNRLSPTELSHYLKHRSVIQHPMFNSNPQQGLRSGSISPNLPPPEQFLLLQAKAHQNSALAAAATLALQDSGFSSTNGLGLFDSSALRSSDNKTFLDSDFNLNTLPYLNQFQQLLLAN